MHGLAPGNFRRPEFVNDDASRMKQYLKKEVEYVHKQFAVIDRYILVSASDELDSAKGIRKQRDSTTLNQKVANDPATLCRRIKNVAIFPTRH